ncbi:ADP-ribosylation factor-related protein 1-like [Sinocyclocheilus rhinocerous]|uniref:ADP-ribosylation factor-related protein 1-like n=1 Tax=Sinocyclocheilus rhinocerous TaxID=307959 RepID=UPI0007B7E044|nr:PREDICTED: ADP-ribosylation factor-related protein 1-like [Sinocyclocheilus rhinocerous]
MYTLLSGLYKYMFQKDEYCVLILGLDNAGKTTFLEQTKTKFIHKQSCLSSVPQNCLSVPDIKTAFSDCAPKIGKRDCLVQPCSALSGQGVNDGIEWMVKCVIRNIHRPPRQKDIT